jgi:hypothetical protein
MEVGTICGNMCPGRARGIGLLFVDQAQFGRGRDVGYPAPPAQIPASGTTAPHTFPYPATTNFKSRFSAIPTTTI